MAQGLSKITNDIKNIIAKAASNVKGNIAAIKNPSTRKDFLSGLGYSLNNPSGSKMSITSAIRKTAPTVARDFGNTISGKGTQIAKVPVVKQVARMAGNTGETIGSGVVDVTRGAYQATIKPGNKIALGERLKGLATAAYGGAKIVSANPANPAGKIFQGANIISQLPQTQTQRLATGIIRGQTGIKTLSPDTQEKKTKIKIAGKDIEFDPLTLAGEMYGFTQNPINAKIFKGTEKFNLIPNAKGFVQKAANFILTNALRGGTEDVLMSIKDLPDNSSAKEKADFILNNALFGATSEIIFRGGSEAAQKGIKSAFSSKQLAKVFDQIKKAIGSGGMGDQVETAVKRVDSYLRDTKGRFTKADQAKILSDVERLATDPKINLADLPNKVRVAVNEFRFRNNIDINALKTEAGLAPNFSASPTDGNRFLRTELAKSRLTNETPQQAFGAVAGVELERDENGKVIGTKYNPAMGAAGLIVSNPQVRNQLADTLKPKTKLLEQADELLKSGQEELAANREMASMAKSARESLSKGALEAASKVKQIIAKNQDLDADGIARKLSEQTQGKGMLSLLEAANTNSEDEAIKFAMDLPSKAETVAKTPVDIVNARELKKQASEVWDLVYNSETDPRISEAVIRNEQETLAKAANNDFKEYQKVLFEQEGANLTKGQNLLVNIDRIADSIKNNTVASYVSDVNQLNDVGGFARGWKDVFRNFKTVFGNAYSQVKAQVLDPFDAAKGQFVDGLNRHADEMENVIVKQLGINKGSKESEAVQLFGEGKITKDDLVKQFGDETASKIEQADGWFRQQYDSILDEVNAVRAEIYPNNPSKIIPKRANYYRHFTEMAEGIQGLKNIFETPAGIESSLAGTSEFVKPKSKWLSFAQKRLGDKTDIDAVGGFINYVKASEYAKAIDPQIDRFRQLRNELIEVTAPELPDGTPNPNAGKLNNFVEFLDDFANDLSGKTNPIDRALTKLGPTRKALKVLDWINSRVKSNLILGNLSSSVAQFFNVPQGLAEAGPKYSAMGVKSAITDVIANESKATDASTFLKERYEAGSAFSRFDQGLAANTKKFAVWITGALDEVGTKLIWHANYQKAIGEGIENPIKYADDITRSMVAGRGVGEVPLAQKSKVIQLLMPFQLEVGNAWHVMKDWADEGAKSKFLYFTVSSFLLNRLAEKIRGNDVSFDPLNALIEGVQEFEDEANPIVGVAKGVGRVAGEVLSNIPGGQSIASIYPEGGVKLGSEQLTREELFGEGDPTRYGSGLLAIKGLQDPIFKLLTPYGGQQIKRSIEGVKSLAEGAVSNKSGQVQFPVDRNLASTLQSIAFGKYSTENARMYFKEELSPLSEKETALWKSAVEKGEDPVKAWSALYQAKLIRSLPSKMLLISRDSKTPQDQRRREVTKMVEQYKDLNLKLENMGDLNSIMPEVAGEKVKADEFTPSGLLKNNGSVYKKKSGKKPSKPKAPTLKIKKQSQSSSPTFKLNRKSATVQDFL